MTPGEKALINPVIFAISPVRMLMINRFDNPQITAYYPYNKKSLGRMMSEPESAWLVIIEEIRVEHPDITFELEQTEEEDWLIIHITDGQRQEMCQISLRLTDDLLEAHVRTQLLQSVHLFRTAN
jgi:hypothetical protein